MKKFVKFEFSIYALVLIVVLMRPARAPASSILPARIKRFLRRNIAFTAGVT